MKVLHIIGGDLTKGAFLGAYWLHTGLQNHDIESSILGFIPGNQLSDNIRSYSEGWIGKSSDWFLMRQDAIWKKIFRRGSSKSFHVGFFGRDISRHWSYQNADIVHLHWMSNGVVNWRNLDSIEKPVVLTLRDMWAFTGGCHYSLDCSRYQSGCGLCPQIDSTTLKDLSYWSARIKKKHLGRGINAVVGISSWIADCSKKSQILSGVETRVIPNGIDTDEFWPEKPRCARTTLGIANDSNIILVGASNVNSFYKGWSQFIECLQYVKSPNVLVVTFGKPPDTIPAHVCLPFKHLGYIEDRHSLRLAYSAADVFVAPSIQEAFGKTLVESMACGTPVVGFDATGPADIVEHMVTGYKSKPFEAKGLAEGIDWVLERRHDKEMASSCVSRAKNLFSNEAVAKKYIELYRDLLRG
ncbi:MULTISPECIES: glycosyltransferase [unclassified Ectothiorhodospira]|uniref:glycosyltransferase n=1 Tax=unclassified Ectothiorhodospira TaxID=2684909 RepID=UPI001EE7B1E9|nr:MULTISPECIES: glycosyltransferase [unclassified Ectothiorhodospira]MCG5516388.1 glycosyltransferase [Ectothiorhodospira sp. 9100]MCG5519362.1 glycosyltransferase [Ectothiorhodospira sp. 9905]